MGPRRGVLLGGIICYRVRTGSFFWTRDLLKTEMGPLLTPLPRGRNRSPAAPAEGPSASSAALGSFWTSELTLGSGCNTLQAQGLSGSPVPAGGLHVGFLPLLGH